MVGPGYNVAARSEPLSARADRRHQENLPQLGQIAVDYAWSGTLGNSIHRMPQIGELAPGLWLASGFGGHGLNTTAMAGTLIARAIADSNQTWRQFTPFELVWAGGIFGRASAQMYYWVRRARDAIAERRSRAAETARRRACDAAAASAVIRERSAADLGSIVASAADIQTRPDADLTGQDVAANRPRRRKRRQGAKA